MKELGFQNYIETSAFTGHNIQQLFETITKHLYVLNEHKLKDFVSDTHQISLIITLLIIYSKKKNKNKQALSN